MTASKEGFSVSLNPPTMKAPSPPTVAVIGGGVSGMSAARTLNQGGARVIVLESSRRLGGNCFGVEVTAPDGTKHRVDGGVSDFNRNTFKELGEVISELGLETHPISSDLSVASQTGESLLSSINGVLECAAEYGSASDLATEMASFRVRCEEAVTNKKFSGWTISQYLDHINASKALRDAFVLPRAMGSFPMPDKDPKDMPMDELVRFWLIHGIVGSVPADRHTVRGGMYNYIEKLAESLEESGVDVRLETRVFKVSRFDGRVDIHITDSSGKVSVLKADQVVFSIHARSVLPLIADDVDVQEASALAGFKVQRARVVVHHDPALMANDRNEWGAFNYIAPEGKWPTVRPAITFYPNRLARLPAEVPDTFVTMNPYHEPRAETIVSDQILVHPVSVGGKAGQMAIEAVEKMQGLRRTWWAGSYLRSPYVHESAWITGRVAAESLLSKLAKTDNAMGEELHEMTITFVDQSSKKLDSSSTFDVKVSLRAPRSLAIRGIQVV